jgi:outer membrane protein TolC
MPALGLSASTEGRDRELELQTPIGSFPFGADNFESAGVEIRQPVLDPARLLHANPATRDEARAQRLGAERARQTLAGAAASAYLEVLAIDARRGATQALIESLGNRLAEVTARVDEGRALRVDALKIRQALERAELERLALDESRAVALLALAQSVGSADPVQPTSAPDWLHRSLPEMDEVTSAALERRGDLASFAAAAEAAAKRRAQVRAELIPRLDARASYVWSNGTPYAQESWFEGGLFIRWTPVAAGTRGPRAAALAHERSALERDLAEAVAGLKVEIRSALAELATARDAVEVGRRGVEQALETLRVDTERFDAGRLTTNDLLEAEALLREQRTLFEVARLDVVRAWVRLWLAAGFDDPEELNRWG